MVLFALHNAYGKGFIPSEPKSCSTEQALTFAGQAWFVYSKTNGYCPDSYGLLYSSKILNTVMSLMGKYMKPCGKIESFWKGKLGYLLWENVFLMWKPWIPCMVTGSPREKFWEYKWVLTNSLMGILLVAVFFSAAGEKILIIWPSICMFSSAKTPFLCY